MALSKGLGWLLDDLTKRVAQVRHALVLSNDGLVTGASAALQREDAEHLAAVSSGLHSLAKGSGNHFRAGRVRQTMVEFDEGSSSSPPPVTGSCLCVLSGPEADIGQVAYEMTLLVNSVGEHLGVEARQETPELTAGEWSADLLVPGSGVGVIHRRSSTGLTDRRAATLSSSRSDDGSRGRTVMAVDEWSRKLGTRGRPGTCRSA